MVSARVYGREQRPSGEMVEFPGGPMGIGLESLEKTNVGVVILQWFRP